MYTEISSRGLLNFSNIHRQAKTTRERKCKPAVSLPHGAKHPDRNSPESQPEMQCLILLLTSEYNNIPGSISKDRHLNEQFYL